MKAVSIILLLILLAGFSLSVAAEKEGTFGLGACQLPFLYRTDNCLRTIHLRYWWKEGIGIEGNMGDFSSVMSHTFHSGSLLFPFFRTTDTNIYLSLGLHANGDQYHANQLFQLLGDILTPANYSGGYHIGLGVEIVITQSLTLDLRVEHYENTWPTNHQKDYGAGGNNCRLTAGAGVIYYF